MTSSFVRDAWKGKNRIPWILRTPQFLDGRVHDHACDERLATEIDGVILGNAQLKERELSAACH